MLQYLSLALVLASAGALEDDISLLQSKVEVEADASEGLSLAALEFAAYAHVGQPAPPSPSPLSLLGVAPADGTEAALQSSTKRAIARSAKRQALKQYLKGVYGEKAVSDAGRNWRAWQQQATKKVKRARSKSAVQAAGDEAQVLVDAAIAAEEQASKITEGVKEIYGSTNIKVSKEDLEYEQQLRKSDLGEDKIQALLDERLKQQMAHWEGDNGKVPKNFEEAVACKNYECPSSYAKNWQAEDRSATMSSGRRICCKEVPDFFRYEGFYLPSGNDLVGEQLHAARILNIEDVHTGNPEEMAEYMNEKTQLLTLAEAKAKCTSSKDCSGFTHEGESPHTPEDKVYVSFKSKNTMYPSVDFDHRWTAYLLHEADSEQVNMQLKSTPMKVEQHKHDNGAHNLPGAIRNLEESEDYNVYNSYEQARLSGDRKALEKAEESMRLQGKMVPPRGDVKLKMTPEDYQIMMVNYYAAEKVRKEEEARRPENPAEESAPRVDASLDTDIVAPKKLGQRKLLKLEQERLLQGQTALTEQLAKLQEQLVQLKAAKDAARNPAPAVEEASAPIELVATEGHRAAMEAEAVQEEALMPELEANRAIVWGASNQASEIQKEERVVAEVVAEVEAPKISVQTADEAVDADEWVS